MRPVCWPRGAICPARPESGKLKVPARKVRPLLGGRSTVGHVALDHVIGVRIPASQPDFARASRELRLGRQDGVSSLPAYSPASVPYAKSVSPKPAKRAKADHLRDSNLNFCGIRRILKGQDRVRQTASR